MSYARLRTTLSTLAASQLHWMEGWILQVLYCDPNGSRAFLRILSTEGRGVRIWWAHSKPKRPKQPSSRLTILGQDTEVNFAGEAKASGGPYRGTSLKRKRPPPSDHLRTLGRGLR